MRILFLSTWYPCPPDNGSKLRAFYLAGALARQHAVTVAAFRPGVGPRSSDSETALPGVDFQAVDADPFRYVSLPEPLRYVSPIPLVYWPSHTMRQTLTRLRQSERWDAVVAIQMPVAQYTLRWPVPRILDVDTGLAYQMRERARTEMEWTDCARALVSWQKAQRYETYMVRRCQAVTVVANHEVDYLRSMIGRSKCRVAVVPNGVDLARNRPGVSAPRANRLVYNGALTYSANYDAMRWFLAEVYPRIRAQVPEVSLAITGSLKGVDLAGLALDGSVHLTGYVADVRLPVAEAVVCVVPIRQGGGTRLKILEAMALGTPVVSTVKGAEGLDVVDGEHCLVADTSEAFAAQTVRLLHRADLRRRLAANARKLVEERYDWEQIGRQFTSLVEEVVEARGSRERRR